MPPEEPLDLRTALARDGVPFAIRYPAVLAKAGEALKVLEESGFDVATEPVSFTDLGVKVKGSALLFRHGQQDLADVVHGYLPSLKTVEVPTHDLSTPVAVVVSSGYKTLGPGQEGGGGQPSCPGA